jgi:Protein of unknown function DUF115
LHGMSVKKTAYKNFSTFCLDCINTLASILKVLLMSKSAPKFPAPKEDTCLVLGNGPSLKSALANKRDYFRHGSLMCVNTFSLSPEYTDLKPTYYVMLDPGLWHADNNLIRETMEAIGQKTTWPLHLIVPHEARMSKYIASFSGHSSITVHYINYVVFKGFEKTANYFFRKNKAMPQSQNVLVASLFFAINIGFKRIELFGADHNWHEQIRVNEDNIVCVKQVHFYENEMKVEYLPFYKAMHIKETFRMDEAFHAWAKVFYGYIRIRKYADSRGCKIFNATENSYVDAFPRIHI